MQLPLFEHYSEVEIEGETQVCKVCSKEKHISLFPKHIQFKTGIDNRCKACIKKQSRLRNELRKRWGHLKTDICDCCGNTHRKTLVLDHDHNTLRFRGFICEDCNQGLGKLGDNIEGLEKAITYLRKANERT
jgi:acetyltransferase-like isoleucine patch superfamily enzyme